MALIEYDAYKQKLRELEPEDRKDLAEILQDPQVMYAYEHEFTDDDVQAWLTQPAR